MGGNTALCGDLIEQQDGIGRPARLERTDFLKIFGFEKQRCTGRGIEARAGQYGGAIDVWANARVRFVNFWQINHTQYQADGGYGGQS